MSKNEPKDLKLIVSDDERPISQDQKYQVVSVSLVDPELKKSSKIGARLCGGTSTCLALMDVGTEDE